MNDFDDFDTQYQCEDVYLEDALSVEWNDTTDDSLYWAELIRSAQYDDDPSPYDGTYSEE